MHINDQQASRKEASNCVSPFVIMLFTKFFSCLAIMNIDFCPRWKLSVKQSQSVAAHVLPLLTKQHKCRSGCLAAVGAPTSASFQGV